MTNTNWTNPVSGDWTNAGDWTPGVPAAEDNAIINAAGSYTVTISSADVAQSLTMDAAGATLSENSGGSLTMAGGLTLDSGTVILNGANSFGGPTELAAGTLKLGNTAALGTSALTIGGGALIGTETEIVSNAINAGGTFTFAAASGDKVRLRGHTALDISAGGTVSFGLSGDNGVFIWDPATIHVVGSVAPAALSVDVNYGTLRDGNGKLNALLSAADHFYVAQGARLDVNGHSDAVAQLAGSGTVTSRVAGDALTVGQNSSSSSSFSGKLEGDLALTVNGTLHLTNASTYTGGTTINSGAQLFVESNGSIRGGIVDNGLLDINRKYPGTVVLNDPISGTGSLEVDRGVVTLRGINTYSGGTDLTLGGTVKVGNASALGTGAINSAGGQLVGMVTESLSNQLSMSFSTKFFAAHGTTLTLNTGAAWTLDPNASVAFGSVDNDGVIVWDSPAGSSEDSATPHYITIYGGTLRAGDSNFQTLLDAAVSTDDGPGETTIGNATLDVAGFASTIYNVEQWGTIANSGAATTVTIDGGFLMGTFSGPITLDLEGQVQVSGTAANFNAMNVLANSTVDLPDPTSTHFLLSAHDTIMFDNPSKFTGNFGNLLTGDQFDINGIRGSSGITIGYNGDTTGGTLTVSNAAHVTIHLTLVGDYTASEFSAENNGYILFTPSTPASTHADVFDFSDVSATHVAPEAGAIHMRGGHDANELALARDATEILHAHGTIFDHVVHDLFVHGHAGTAEALF